jgi:hypothetical protein
MRIQFTAQELFFENDGDVAYANLMGGDGDEPEHFLIFQRGLMDDDQAIHWNQPDYLKASNMGIKPIIVPVMRVRFIPL